MSKTNEVAVVEKTTTAVATYQEPFDNGLGELEVGDLIIPRLSITQATTPDIAPENAGKFCINVTGDYAEKMTAVLIKLTKSRILFPEKYKRDNEPLCRSHDFKFPAKDIKGATEMCDSCGLAPIVEGEKRAKHKCEYANWGKDGSAPRCQETWNFLLVDLESYMPMFFSLKSTALKPTRKIVSAISMISQAKRLPMWGMKFDMALDKTTNDSGTFYLPVFSGLAALEKDEASIMADIRKQLANVDIKDSTEPDMPDAPAFKAPEQEEF